MWVYKTLVRCAKWCTTNECPPSVGGAEVGGEAVAVGAGAGAETRLAQRALQAAPPAPPVIAVIARKVPSAQATLISSEEAIMYETAAAAVVTSDAV